MSMREDIVATDELTVTLLQLQIVADQPSVTRLGALLADGVKFTHKSGHHSSIPSAPPAPPSADSQSIDGW